MANKYRQNTAHDFIRKDYITPTIDIIEGDFDGGSGNRYSLPYGLCKGAGIDTDGMTPREAWEAYTNKTGVSKKQAEEAHWGVGEEKAEDFNPLNCYTDKQKQIIEEFRQSRQKKAHEESVVCDDSGRIISDKRGNSSSVSFSPWEYKKFEGASLIHNHPQANTFLSDADISFLLDVNLRTIEAVGYDGDIHVLEIVNFIPKPDYLGIYTERKVQEQKEYEKQRKNIQSFLFDYAKALREGQQEARKVWDSLPKKKVQTGRYFVSVPENYEVYRKGASPREYTNYPEYTKIIQDTLIRFSKTAEQKYGIKSKIIKGESKE